MPLTGGQITGYDSERLAFAFTMMNGDEAVPCQISDAAMDELAGTKGTPSIARQAQFLAHREAIERIASDLYDEAPRFKGYEPPPNWWTPVVGSQSQEVSDGRTSTSVVYG
jgi:hypothetical protein